MKRWSKLKKKIENLFVPELKLALHCNVYKVTTKHYTYTSPRTWLQCDKQILWDFPGMFFFWKNPNDESSIEYMEEFAEVPGRLIDQYSETPVHQLLKRPFEDDAWELTDTLKVADRRLGRDKLLQRYGHYPVGHPVGMILRKRFEGTPCTRVSERKHLTLRLQKEITGLPLLLDVRSRILQDGFSSPRDIPSLRIITVSRSNPEAHHHDRFLPIHFADEVRVSPEGAQRWFFDEQFKAELPVLFKWITLNRNFLLELWQDGASWDPEQIALWKAKLIRQNDP